jgi:hypothetical protein
MVFKYTVLFASGAALCLMIITAAAQTADEDRQAVTVDQQALDADYRQLQQDRSAGNAAGIEIDEDNIAAAEQDFQTDIKRTLDDDQKNVSADRQALDVLDQQLQQDMQENPGAIAADKDNISDAQRRLQADSRQVIADDGLEVARDRQALDNGNLQLHQDLQGPEYALGGPDMVRTDKQNISQARVALQEAQLRLRLDSNQSWP